MLIFYSDSFQFHARQRQPPSDSDYFHIQRRPSCMVHTFAVTGHLRVYILMHQVLFTIQGLARGWNSCAGYL